jgi:heptosyltransferase-2
MNIALFCPNWVGDVVMATPAMTAIRRRYPNARIVGLLKPYVQGVVDGGPWFDRVIHVNGGERSQGVFAVARELRRLKIDVAVLFPNSFRSALTAWLGGARRIVGYARGGRTWLLTDALEPLLGRNRDFVPSPIIDAYNRLAEHMDCERPGYQMRLFTSGEDEQLADEIWQRHRLREAYPVIAFNPGAAFGAAKYWPVDYFAQLAQRLVDRRRASILVLCGPAEREMAARIAELANRPSVTSLADEAVSLGLLKACVRRCDLLITTDSGPRHFAAAFDRPVVTLFGPTHIAWTETYYARAVNLQKAVECGPCQLRVCPLDHRCMKLLTPAEVYETATALLMRDAYQEPARRTWSWFPFRWDRSTH